MNLTLSNSIIRNRNTADFGALAQAYTRTYGALPSATDAAPMDRDLIDMDDATAQAQLKTLKEAEAISDHAIAASLAMEDEAKVAAPGTADYIVAAGVIAAVQNQAVMQKMIAAEMRQEAARLAHRRAVSAFAAAEAVSIRRSPPPRGPPAGPPTTVANRRDRIWRDLGR